MKTHTALTVLASLITLPLSAAIYTGTGFSGFDPGSFSGTSSTDTSTTTAVLNPGVLSSVIVESEFVGNLTSSSTRNSTDPITFVTSTWTSRITITNMSSYLELGSASLFSSGTGLAGTAMIVASSMTIEGSYEIVGPSTTTTQPFTLNGVIESPGNPFAGIPQNVVELRLDNLDIPNSFTLTTNRGSIFRSFDDGALIFDTIVDGLQLTGGISDVWGGGGGGLLTAIPEPSSSFLFACASILGALRRRRT